MKKKRSADAKKSMQNDPVGKELSMKQLALITKKMLDSFLLFTDRILYHSQNIWASSFLIDFW